MSKRGLNEFDTRSNVKRRKLDDKKHSLDSDEEDNDDEEIYNVMNDDEFEGEEEGVARDDGEVRTTAFNMKEEMEEGHFDKDGHFLWKKEKEIRDNWLDNIDWQRIRPLPKQSDEIKGLGEDSDSDDIENETELYKKILVYLKPKESISKAIRRLAGDTKLSSLERLKRKKAGTLTQNEDVIKLTELANSLLNLTGNMDIYQETYEQISRKIEPQPPPKEAELDMYADDFGSKEKQRLDEPGSSSGVEVDESAKPLMWEFKWSQDGEEIHGPHTTQQMQNWVNEGYFKSGVWVRKCGQEGKFYASKRIDFELYLS